jgi:hypothetical protein
MGSAPGYQEMRRFVPAHKSNNPWKHSVPAERNTARFEGGAPCACGNHAAAKGQLEQY